SGKAGAFPQNIYFQMTKNTVLKPEDFADMVSPNNPNGDQLKSEFFSGMVDALPNPGALWSDSQNKLSDVLETILEKANTDSKPSESQLKDYKSAYDFLNNAITVKDRLGDKQKVVRSDIAVEYDDAQSAYVAAVQGYRNAYNGYDLTKKE